MSGGASPLPGHPLPPRPHGDRGATRFIWGLFRAPRLQGLAPHLFIVPLNEETNESTPNLGATPLSPSRCSQPPSPISREDQRGIAPPQVPSLEESSPLGENQHFTRVSSLFFTVLSKQMVQLMNMKLQQEEKPPDQSRCDLRVSAEAVTAAATNARGQRPGVVQSCKHQPGPWPCAGTGRKDGC